MNDYGLGIDHLKPSGVTLAEGQSSPPDSKIDLKGGDAR